MLSFTPAESRKLLETAFEPQGAGFVYYRNRWSPGIPVSAEEREAYVSRWYLGSTAAFHKRIAGRAPVTPARGGRAMGSVMRAIPARFGVILFGGAVLGVLMGLIADSSAERWFMWACGAISFVVGMTWAVVRRLPEPHRG